MQDLIDVLVAGSGTAVLIIAQTYGITLGPPALERVQPLLAAAITQEYQEIISQADGLLLLGDGWIKEALNLACTHAAIAALKKAGLLLA